MRNKYIKGDKYIYIIGKKKLTYVIVFIQLFKYYTRNILLYFAFAFYIFGMKILNQIKWNTLQRI